MRLLPRSTCAIAAVIDKAAKGETEEQRDLAGLLGATGQSVDKGVVTARRGGDGLDGHGHHRRGPLAVDVGREPHHCEQEGED